MEITFLGTSYAVPTKERNHTAIFISHEGQNILIDCGEGTQRQFRKANLNPQRLTHLLITHWHGDHILGIPGLMQTLSLHEYNRTLKIYGPPGIKRHMDELSKVFLKDNKVRTEIHELGEASFEDKGLVFKSFKMQHGVPCLAYSIEQKEKTKINMGKLKKIGLSTGPLIGELQKGKDITFNGKSIKSKDIVFKEKGKKISIILDTATNENCIKAAKDADILVCEATYLEEDKEKAREYGHMTSSQAGEVAKKAMAKSLLLTHISQRYDFKKEKILKEAKKHFKNTKIAEDLMKVEV